MLAVISSPCCYYFRICWIFCCRQNPLWEKVVVNSMELIFALYVMKFTSSARGTSCCVWCSVVVMLTSQQKIIWMWLINYSSKVVFPKICLLFYLQPNRSGFKGPLQTCFSFANLCLIWFYTKTLKAIVKITSPSLEENPEMMNKQWLLILKV